MISLTTKGKRKRKRGVWSGGFGFVCICMKGTVPDGIVLFGSVIEGKALNFEVTEKAFVNARMNKMESDLSCNTHTQRERGLIMWDPHHKKG